MSDAFGLVVRFTLHPGAGEGFDRLVAETVEQIRAHEPGTLIYDCHQVADEPDQRIFYELYRDRAAFDEHERQEHIRRFHEARTEFVHATTVDFLSPTTTKTVHSPVVG